MSVSDSPRNPLLQRRRAGVLLHPTSLPGDGPSGTLGAEAYAFLDWAHQAGFSLWQILPLNPPQEDGSPYASISAFAGDTRLIDPERLAARSGWSEDASGVDDLLDFILQRGASNPAELNTAWSSFCTAQGPVWLDDYARFVVIRAQQSGRPWWEWPRDLRDRDPDALARLDRESKMALDRVRLAQFVYLEQWQELRAHAHTLDILILGDMPIFVAHDSADVWAHREWFDLRSDGQPNTVTGVPPDYFSPTGQRWGNPQYNWEALAATGYQWWVDRVGWTLEAVDAVRIDHFRGFEASWAIPASEPDATQGRWVAGPGADFFQTLQARLPDLPVLAEDLGMITEAVTALRRQFGFPGMRILQFAFDGGTDNPYLPNNHDESSVVYTGTHDNDTTLGWYESLPADLQARVVATLDQGPATEMPWPMLRAAYHSPAQLAVVPMQDALELDGHARMNRPGTVGADNWRWRFTWTQLPPGQTAALQRLAQDAARL